MGGRPPIMRAERWPIMRTVGSCMAVTTRLGLRGAIEVEVVVHRGQAPVEAAPELEVVVELAVGADVQLDAVEEPQRVAELRLQRADARALLEQRLAADARQRALGVIGDGQDAVAARPGGGDDLLERRAPVARDRGVHVEVADDGADRGGAACRSRPPRSRRRPRAAPAG